MWVIEVEGAEEEEGEEAEEEGGEEAEEEEVEEAEEEEVEETEEEEGGEEKEEERQAPVDIEPELSIEVDVDAPPQPPAPRPKPSPKPPAKGAVRRKPQPAYKYGGKEGVGGECEPWHAPRGPGCVLHPGEVGGPAPPPDPPAVGCPPWRSGCGAPVCPVF